ncbi:MAG: hypothetical protein WC788_07785 [Candidatus Paceibacterota bacterium]
MDDKTKKINKSAQRAEFMLFSLTLKIKKLAKRAEFMLFSLTFFIIVALAATSSDKMDGYAFLAESFVLTFVFTGLTGPEYLYKMPAITALAIVIGTAIAHQLTMITFGAIIIGAILSIVFMLIAMKLNSYRQDIIKRT